MPYLERKSTEEPSGVLEQGVDGLAGERSSGLNGLDGPNGEPQIRGGEKPRRGHSGGRLRGVVARQERQQRWGK